MDKKEESNNGVNLKGKKLGDEEMLNHGRNWVGQTGIIDLRGNELTMIPPGLAFVDKEKVKEILLKDNKFEELSAVIAASNAKEEVLIHQALKMLDARSHGPFNDVRVVFIDPNQTILTKIYSMQDKRYKKEMTKMDMVTFGEVVLSEEDDSALRLLCWNINNNISKSDITLPEYMLQFLLRKYSLFVIVIELDYDLKDIEGWLKLISNQFSKSIPEVIIVLNNHSNNEVEKVKEGLKSYNWMIMGLVVVNLKNDEDEGIKNLQKVLWTEGKLISDGGQVSFGVEQARSILRILKEEYLKSGKLPMMEEWELLEVFNDKASFIRCDSVAEKVMNLLEALGHVWRFIPMSAWSKPQPNAYRIVIFDSELLVKLMGSVFKILSSSVKTINHNDIYGVWINEWLEYGISKNLHKQCYKLMQDIGIILEVYLEAKNETK